MRACGHRVKNGAFGGRAAIEENSRGFQAGGEVVVADPGKIIEGDREQGSVRDLIGDFDAGEDGGKAILNILEQAQLG